MRNKTLSAIVALSGLAAVAMPAGARVKKDATPLYKNASAPVEERVNDLLSRMTLEEKIMQLNQYTLGRNTVENNLREMAGAVPAEAGSVIYFSDDANLRNMMQKRCMEETRLGIPMIFGHDVIHGYRTMLRYRSRRRPAGIPTLSGQSAVTPPRRLTMADWIGPFLLWWTLPATLGGDE